MTSKTKLLRSKTELPWNHLLDKNLLFFFFYSNAVLLACHICWCVVALECVYVYRRSERVSFPPGVNTVWNSVCVFSFFPQMFTLACEIEWLRQPALHQRIYTAFTVNVINELWPQTLQTAKLTQTLPVTGQILRSPKQWPKSLVITTELSEFIYFYFRYEHKSCIDGVKGWSGITVMEVEGTAECMQILIEMQLTAALWQALTCI